MKTWKIAEILRTKFRKILENREILSYLFWYFGFIKVYFVFCYFAYILYFNFEIFKIPHPGCDVTRLEWPWWFEIIRLGQRVPRVLEGIAHLHWSKARCPLARLKRTGYPPDQKIGDFAEIISTFLATPLPLFRQIWDFAEILWSIFQSREIPTNFHQNLLENTWNWFKNRKKWWNLVDKNAKIKTKNWQIFECGAVQRNANLVDLEKCEKMRLLSLS